MTTDSPHPSLSAFPEIMLIMPVFNEQASLRKVVNEWFAEVEDWTESFVFLAINDGSTDGSSKILNRLKESLGSRLEILEQANRGHGQSCLLGYRLAIERRIPYVFQIDSDGQCDPRHFFKFWRERERYTVIYGNRTFREDGFRRVLASKVLRLYLLLCHSVNCIDANVPYRLMKTAEIAPLVESIPGDFSLANVALAVLLRRRGRPEGIVPIRFRERYGGEPSVKLGRFGAKAIELDMQLRNLLLFKEKVR